MTSDRKSGGFLTKRTYLPDLEYPLLNFPRLSKNNLRSCTFPQQERNALKVKSNKNSERHRQKSFDANVYRVRAVYRYSHVGIVD